MYRAATVDAGEEGKAKGISVIGTVPIRLQRLVIKPNHSPLSPLIQTTKKNTHSLNPTAQNRQKFKSVIERSTDKPPKKLAVTQRASRALTFPFSLLSSLSLINPHSFVSSVPKHQTFTELFFFPTSPASLLSFLVTF